MHRIKLLGEYLREEGRLSSRQVVEGLREQVKSNDSGQPRRLGEILVSLGYVSSRDVERAASRQTAELPRRGAPA